MKHILSIMLCGIMLIMGMPVVSWADEVGSEEIENQDSEYVDNEIDSLLDERAELINLEKYEEVDNVENQLCQLGVEILTPEEVEERYIYNNSDRNMFVDVPVSNNVKWFSSKVDYNYNGKTYVIQTLTAQPSEKDSKLKMKGSRAISSSYNWKAGGMNVVEAVAYGVAGEIIPKKVAFTVYQAAVGCVQGITRETEITSASVVYSWAHVVTATFKYIKEKGQPDSYQSLAYISTKGSTSIGYQWPTFYYKGGSALPNVIQGKRTINSQPDGYNSNINAVKAYLKIDNKTRAWVEEVRITGIESKLVSSIYPVCPQFPAHIYY